MINSTITCDLCDHFFITSVFDQLRESDVLRAADHGESINEREHLTVRRASWRRHAGMDVG